MDPEQFVELQKAREIGLKRKHYNLDVIPLLPRVRTKTPEQWLEFAKKYSVSNPFSEKFRSKKLYHDNKGSHFNPFTAPFKNPLKGLDEAPHKTKKLLAQESILHGHLTALTKLPSGDYAIFDPHGIGSTDPRSKLKLRVPQIKKLIEDPGIKINECEDMGSLFQTSRGVCALWTELRRLHPEKSDEEFRQMVGETISRSGLKSAYIQYMDDPKATRELTNDLIPLDIFEQMKERSKTEQPMRPTMSAETSREEREQHRTGLGKYKKQLFSYPDTFI
jgi:hypothetical protein